MSILKTDHADIVVFDLASGMDLELDIALAHPWSNEIKVYQLQLREQRQPEEKI